jgi:hypothetical protein
MVTACEAEWLLHVKQNGYCMRNRMVTACEAEWLLHVKPVSVFIILYIFPRNVLCASHETARSVVRRDGTVSLRMLTALLLNTVPISQV